MSFMFGSKDPDLRAAEKAAKQVRRDAERAAAAERYRLQEEARKERERLEREARKRRFESFPEFIVREYREVTVKARNEHEARIIAAQAFSKGQDSETYSVRRHLAYELEGDSIDRIRQVTIKLARFLD